ncbi:BTB/POZ protein [Trichoderma chlorosporum]
MEPSRAGVDFKSMMRSGKFSDLTLICQGKEFKIHKVVACPQSPVFSAAVSGEFKESKTGVIEIELFDSETVRRMVEFLYTGNYDCDQPPKQKTATTDAASPAATVKTAKTASCPLSTTSKEALPAPPATASTHETLTHVRVNAIADYYGIHGLTLLANQKIQQAYQSKWDAQAFLTSAKETLDNSGDKKLHNMMALLAAQNLEELIAFPQLTDLVGDFAAQILRFHAHKFVAAKQEQRQEIQKEQLAAHMQQAEVLAMSQAAEAKTGRVIANMRKLITTLDEREYCRNTACEEEFGCYIEQIGEDEPSYVLRCIYCRCRH